MEEEKGYAEIENTFYHLCHILLKVMWHIVTMTLKFKYTIL